jgi:hypothetical protein
LSDKLAALFYQRRQQLLLLRYTSLQGLKPGQIAPVRLDLFFKVADRCIEMGERRVRIGGRWGEREPLRFSFS